MTEQTFTQDVFPGLVTDETRALQALSLHFREIADEACGQSTSPVGINFDFPKGSDIPEGNIQSHVTILRQSRSVIFLTGHLATDNDIFLTANTTRQIAG